MSARPPVWVLCGGATWQAAPEDALRINIGPGDGREIGVHIDGLEDVMTGRLPDRLRDLICIAAFVLAADCGTRRGTEKSADDGLSWRRDFRFVIPVVEPEFWRRPRMRSLLETSVGFLSDDHYHFEFVQGTGWEGRQVSFQPVSGRTFVPWNHIEEVMLFSGGMDSFAGAVQEILVDQRNVLLVSHRASTRLHGLQRALVADLVKRSANSAPRHVGVTVEKRDQALRVEPSQRSRSFLFASIAGAVAWLCGRRRIRFYENGIIALNLPVAPQLIGARGTRTVHPRVIEDFAKILSEVVGETFEVDNPFQDKTRADVAEIIRDGGAADLLKYTWSCARVRHAKRDGPFCGACSQCVDRQFAIRAAGLLDEEPPTLYELHLFQDALTKPAEIQMALGYVDTARTFKKVKTPVEFLSRFGAISDALPALGRSWGCSQEEALSRVVELHKRQGAMVMDVLGEELKRRTPELGDAVHPDSLIGRYLGRGLEVGRQVHGGSSDSPGVEPLKPASMEGDAVDPVEQLLPGRLLERNMFFEVGDGWFVGLEGTRAAIVADSPGMPFIRLLLRHPGRAFPVRYLEAVVSGSEPPPTAGALPTTDEKSVNALKGRISELREEEEELRGIGLGELADERRLEREEIEDQLRRDLGLGGAVRDVAPEVERARDRVRKRIDRAVAEIRKKRHGKILARHLGTAITKGYNVVYEPSDRATTWLTEDMVSSG